MSIQRKHLNRLFCALSISTLVALLGIGPVSAKDTDVYLMSPSVARDDSPNVLIIIDNSGSMDTVLPTTAIVYDPSIDYCSDSLDTLTGITGAASNRPSNCSSISGRIYWSFSSSVPATTSNNWFDATKNHCEDSKTTLTGTSSSSNGIYSNEKIAGLIPSGSEYLWGSINGKTNSDITFIDCQPDANNIDGYPKRNVIATNSLSDAYTSTFGSRFRWGNFDTDTSPTLYNSNRLAYENNSSLQTGSTNTTRLDAAKAAIKELIDSNPSVRFGLMTFNQNNGSDATDTADHGGRVIMKIDTMDAARRISMKSVVDNLVAYGFTPLAETLWESRRYFGGLGVDYGNNDTSATPARDTTAESGTNYISPFKFGCQTSYIIYVTDGDPTRDTNANSSSKITGLSGLSSCDGSSCLDDLAGWMHDHDVYSSLPGEQRVTTFTIGFGDGISASGKALLQEAATAGGGEYKDAVNASELSTALRGALSKAFETNTSYAAPSLSINAFNKLYNRDDVYFALFKPNSSVAWDGNIKKFKLCNSADATAYGCTFGEVIDFNSTPAPAIDSQTSKIKATAKSDWSSVADGPEVTVGGAGEQITKDTDPPLPRTLYTYRGSYASASMPATPEAVVATAGSGTTLYDVAINDPTILGLTDTSGSASTTNPTDTTAVTNLITWMRGKDAYDQRKDSGTDTGHTGVTDEARSWNFADPLHSRPVAFTFGSELDAFSKPDPTKPIIKLFVGTNDGMVRMINNSTGKEEWGFIPKELLDEQYTLSQDADADHIYGLDDSPAFLVNDVNNDGIIDPATDKVYMYIGMRRGGRNLYAFDVTPAAKMTVQTDTVTPKLKWVIEGGTGNFAKLGQTWSRPKVARIRAKCSGSTCDDGNATTDDSESRMVLIFGGGYDIIQDNSIPAGPDSMGNAIYIVDPFTGERIWWASSDTGASKVLSNMKYSIPSEITALDTNGDKSVDRLYVGDTGGQIWRIDLGDQITSTSNGGTTGYMFADVGCNGDTRANSCAATTNQDRRKFFYPPDVAQVKDSNYSTSENYDLVTIGSGDREDPLDLLTTKFSPVQEAVKNRIYAFRDYDYKVGAPASTPSALTDNTTGGDLYDATANNLGTMTGSTRQAEIDTNVKTSKGWYIDLKELSDVTLTNGLTTKWVGEKVLAKTLIYNGTLFVTTFIPANDSTALNTCQANEGEGRFYELNYLTGEPAYDLNGDGALDRYAVAGGGIPSEVIIVIRDGGVTGLVGTSGGAKLVNPGGGSNRYKTFWWDE